MKREHMKNKDRMGARAWRAVVAGLALAGSVFAGAKFRAKLPRETDDHGFYADIGVFAFPTPPAEKASFDGVAVKVKPDASSSPAACATASSRFRRWRRPRPTCSPA